jgi:TonB family protein
LTFFVMPLYFEALRKQGVGGKVTLALTIDSNGKVVNAEFVRGERKLAEISAKALRMWEFKPLVFNSEPLGMTGQITFEYEAKSGHVRFASTSGPVGSVKTP